MHMRAHLTLPTQRINKVWRATRRWLAFVVVVLTAGAGPAGAETEPAAPENPPGLVLVLSGGGARGAAHIGALRVLEELKVVPDMIIGTSMGSIVGGLYAAGWSPDELEELLATVDWNQVFTDHISRRQLSFRRKQDDRPFLIPNRLHFDDNGFYLPPGLLGGQSLHLLLASLEARSLPDDDFDRLPIPFRAIGADIESGRAVVLDRGSLATAMRASMAIPGVFSPVEWNDHTLSDGGAVANLPIGIAQQLGAEQIIAIDIASPLMSPGKKLKNFWSVFKQMKDRKSVV